MERLTAQDLSMLWPDELGWPQDIGAFAMLDGESLLDTDGEVRIELVRQAIADRLHLVPRFRQRLWRPRRGLGWPLWVDVRDFDIADHIAVFRVAAPGDDAQLLNTLEHLRRQSFDRARPLWRMWILDGLSDRRLGFYLRVHHTIADGVAGVATLGALLDNNAGARSDPGPPYVPGRAPSDRDLFIDNVRRRWEELVRVASAVVRPARTMKRLRAAWPAVHETLGAERAPRTSINRPIGRARSFAIIRSKLSSIKQIAHGHGATVNDVLLSAIAGGLGDLLRNRGEHTNEVALRAYVPVSLHRERHVREEANLDGMMAVPLPVGVPDPVLRLRLIAAVTSERKKRSRPAGGTLLRNGMIQRAMLRMMARQRWANVYVANVPGPPMPLSFAGSPVRELFAVVPLIGNVTLGVGALSYAGQFNITVVADHDACPDIEVFVEGVRTALVSILDAGSACSGSRGASDAGIARRVSRSKK